MKSTLKRILSALFQQQSQSNSQPQSSASQSATVSHSSHSSKSDTASPTADERQRCINTLSYWLDSELFDLPECPLESDKNAPSKEAEHFKTMWGNQANNDYLSGKLELNDESKLVIMFQCHRAGYLLEEGEEHPNYQTPRTYLVAQAFIPSWDAEQNTIVWTRSDEEADQTVNLATMRTLYRKCPSSIPNNMSLSEWVEARFTTIENRFAHHFDPEDNEKPLNTDALFRAIVAMNRELAADFWPDNNAKQFLLERAVPIESTLEDSDRPALSQDMKMLTFRWRFCFYKKDNDNQQLGPFFVEDLERSIKECSKGELSKPLQRYLLGAKSQTPIGSALESTATIFPLTMRIPKGRWPENPAYGLSLLQCIAVNVASKQDENPVVAVNGPPGTGKTTLLKDVIAERIVERTHKLLALKKDTDWLLEDTAIEAVMASSIIVASSNNKAVENISKELPALSKIDKRYQDEARHFRSVAQSGDWGLFCAVLGKSNNRKLFKKTLKQLENHLKGLNDHFQFFHFYNSLKKQTAQTCEDVIIRFVSRWKKSSQLTAIIDEIEGSRIRKEHKDFFVDFCHSLQLVNDDKASVEKFAYGWTQLSDEHWDQALNAIDALRKQWFARKLAEQALEDKLVKTEQSFTSALSDYSEMHSDINDQQYSRWGLEPTKHLLTKDSYQTHKDEEPHQAEARLQQSSPLGSEAINHSRTKLFIAALALNEALIERAAKEFKSSTFKDLASLIDGKLETKELKPHHKKLWAMLFLFFPVVSTSLASVENQFRLMQQPEGFGLAMFDESGQAVNYHVAGLLQRCRQAIFVGDPIQLEPVVAMPANIDLAIARDFLEISDKDGEHKWGDDYLITESSAQSIADKACNYYSEIGDRPVGIPLLVHRRCTEPMFSIANSIAYDNKMVLASPPFKWNALQSGWVHVAEQPDSINGHGYFNYTEAKAAIELVQHLCETQPSMVEGGVYIITPFSKMRSSIAKQWNIAFKNSNNHSWMQKAFGSGKRNSDLKEFSKENIGTVHTFQGKEASTVILCTAASSVRKNTGGIQWVNSKPNLINVAVTRAKHHLFVLGNIEDWESGTISSSLQCGNMRCYTSLDQLKESQATRFEDHVPLPRPDVGKSLKFNLMGA